MNITVISKLVTYYKLRLSPDNSIKLPLTRLNWYWSPRFFYVMLCFGISLSSTAGFNSFRPLPTGVRCGFRMIERKTSTKNPLNMTEDMSDICFYCFPFLPKNRPLLLQSSHSKERRFALRRWAARKCGPVKSEVREQKSDDAKSNIALAKPTLTAKLKHA